MIDRVLVLLSRENMRCDLLFIRSIAVWEERLLLEMSGDSENNKKRGLDRVPAVQYLADMDRLEMMKATALGMVRRV